MGVSYKHRRSIVTNLDAVIDTAASTYCLAPVADQSVGRRQTTNYLLRKQELLYSLPEIPPSSLAGRYYEKSPVALGAAGDFFVKADRGKDGYSQRMVVT